MNVDTSLIKNKRNTNAWSQQHLSEIAGLSLRTVQRIESTGSGSADSVKALASAFNVLPSDLMLQPDLDGKETDSSFTSRTVYLSLFGVLFVSICVAVIYLGRQSEVVALELSYSLGEGNENVVYLEDEFGAHMEVRYDDATTFVFVPEKLDDSRIGIQVQGYLLEAGVDRSIIASESIEVVQNQAVSTVIKSHQGKRYQFSLIASVNRE